MELRRGASCHDVSRASIRLGLAFEPYRNFREGVDTRSHRGECRWLFERTLQDRANGKDGHCTDVDAPPDGKPQHGPCSADPHPHL